MVVVELSFTAEPERLAARPAHRALLADLHARGLLAAAGPYSDDSGALLLFTADGPEVAEIIAADPYYRTPGVTVTAVREWNPVVGST
ncbi:YciI family protein [Actinocatenispora rupis]|uniref:YCII-related domain-containing protein n=1 Tax=Actinocatenispora rupis TaxID=519421 RepID=A0A8J3J2U6_9ACTN|nr:YciI family protein [Actinocatenispora rupis]GID11080.1 hypothetical protein Aru02nite_19690 [Actinocatenispora rupis]